MLRDLPIKLLLIAGFLFSGLLPLMGVALMSYSVAREELNQQALRQLESVRDIKKMQLGHFFDERVRQTEVLAADPYVHQSLREFQNLVDGAGGLGRAGLAGHGAGRFDAPSKYRAVHDRHIAFYQTYAEGMAYYDVFLMSPGDGFTYFTVEKEADFGMAIAGVDSSLKDVWSVAATQARVAVSDTRPYAPSGNIPAQFIAAPVMEADRVLGVVAVQISLDSIDAFMSARPGMGLTGESYLVGPDGRMRSDSFLDREGHSVAASFAGTVEENGISSLAVHEAFAGRSGVRKIVSYRGKPVLSAYAPVRFFGVTWAIVAEIGQAEIDAKIAAALNTRITVIIFGSLVLLLFLALTISFVISRGIGRVTDELNRLMGGVLAGQGVPRADPGEVAYDFRAVVSKTNDLIQAYQAKTDESRKLEEVVAYNQRMESLGTLAGGIAHDFNNILAYMLTYGDLVLDDLEPGSPAHERMQQILSGIDRAGELVAQIMTFGRQLRRERRPVEVALIVGEAAKLLRATIPKNISIRTEIEAKGLLVLADPTQLHRILMNLCTNAFHAMLGRGGVLTIRVDEEELACAEGESGPGRSCLIRVSDTGCGIAPEILDRIVEPFFTTKPVGQGSGMGLAVVHGIVASYGGRMHIESQPGQGTTVRVCLPLAPDSLLAEEGPDRAAVQRGSGRLLFVDDDEPVCASVALLMESLGYEVDAHTEPGQALAGFEADPQRYDALITDINMPEMDGVTLSKRVRALRPDLPVLFITGYTDRMDPASAAGLDAQVILKPFKKSEFSVALKACVEGRTATD